MSKVKVSFSVSIDGFAAAPQQSLENPMGVGGEALAEWAFATRTFQRMHGKDGGTTRDRRRLLRSELPERGRLDLRQKHVRTRSRTVA
jgi:hypothetical protein